MPDCLASTAWRPVSHFQEPFSGLSVWVSRCDVTFSFFSVPQSPATLAAFWLFSAAVSAAVSLCLSLAHSLLCDVCLINLPTAIAIDCTTGTRLLPLPLSKQEDEEKKRAKSFADETRRYCSEIEWRRKRKREKNTCLMQNG